MDEEELVTVLQPSDRKRYRDSEDEADIIKVKVSKKIIVPDSEEDDSPPRGNKEDPSSEEDVPIKKKKSQRKKSTPTKDLVFYGYQDYLNFDPGLDDIQQMVKEMTTTTSNKKKLEILRKHIRCIKIHLYVNNPYWQYFVTSQRLRKFQSVAHTGVFKCKNIFSLLDMLKERKITGNAALEACKSFIDNNKKYESLIYCILDKNLKIRCGSNSINKIFPNLVPSFEVALAYNYCDVSPDQLTLEEETWFASRKFDGVRVLCFIKNGEVEFKSRQGNNFVTLMILERCIKKMKLEDGITHNSSNN